MAKHPHRLMLHQKKTWRCMLPGCRYFIHTGLEFTLPGKTISCWGCGEDFTCDETALKEARTGDDMPKCRTCRNPVAFDIDDYTNAKIALSKAGVKHVKDLDPNTRRFLENVEGINFHLLEDEESEHLSDCATSLGGKCDCK